VRCPRVRDRVGEGSERVRFSSAVLPPNARRSKSLEVLIPIHRRLRGSTGRIEVHPRTKFAVRYQITDSTVPCSDPRKAGTGDEAPGVLQWAKANRIRSIVIPIDMFSTRRVRWIFRRLLGPENINVTVHAIVPPWYSTNDWWRHQTARVAGGEEPYIMRRRIVGIRKGPVWGPSDCGAQND
jgi:hypothetical protein